MFLPYNTMLRVAGAMKEGKPYLTDEQRQQRIAEMKGGKAADENALDRWKFNDELDVGAKGHLTKEEFSSRHRKNLSPAQVCWLLNCCT